MSRKKSEVTCYDRILKYMREHGGITQKESSRDLGYDRLSALIHIMRHKMGYNIETKSEHVINRYGQTCVIGRYVLVDDEEVSA